MADLQWNKEFAEEQAGGDIELLTELLGLLRSTSIVDLEKIKTALAAQDGDALADASHSIKGASASLGVEALRLVAYELEEKGRAGDLASLNLDALEDLVGQLSTLK